MNDLVKRLRGYQESMRSYSITETELLMDEAADEIERLTRENTELRSGDVYAKCVQLIGERDECRKLLREACDHMDDTPDGWAEDWIKRATKAVG